MLNIPQYPTYASLPSGSHGDLVEVTTGGIGAYQFVGTLKGENVGFWVPSKFASRLTDYVRTRIGIDTFEIVDGGSGYVASETLTPEGGTADGTNAFDAIITIDSVDGGGAITAATLTNRGTYQSPPSPLDSNEPTGGSGTGALFNFVMQSQGFPCRISVGLGSDTVSILTARGWATEISGSGVTPADVATSVEFDSGTTTSSISSLKMVGTEDIGVSTQEYFQILTCDTSNTPGGSAGNCIVQLSDSNDLRRVAHAYRFSTTDNVASFTENTPPYSLVGRGSVSWTFSAYEALFGRFMLAPNPIQANAEINLLWRSSVGATKQTANALLEEQWADSADSRVDLFAVSQSSQQAVFRVREFHLFKMT